MRTMLSFFLVLSLSISMMASVESGGLQNNYYNKTCPDAERIVRDVVAKAVAKNPGMAAGLIKLHFIDCFIRGCDASVLLDSTPGYPAEKSHPTNNPSLRGFEIIDEAKALLEHYCPKTVSCADILAFAARDSASLSSGPSWQNRVITYAVPGGRYDGRVSNINEVVENIPAPFFNADQLNATFTKKGLSLLEMVALSGAHSFGVSHCSSFTHRLYSFNTTNKQDPSLDNGYAAFLKTKCPNVPPKYRTVDPTVPLDPITPNLLDSLYYNVLIQQRGLFESDQALFTSKLTTSERLLLTSQRVTLYAIGAGFWIDDFAAAMVHMGTIEVKNARQGEIRKNCRVVNHY